MAWLFIDTHTAAEFRVGWLKPEGADLQTVPGRAHALMPTIESLLPHASLDGICVVAGPGRFSAIRTGVLDANLIARWRQVPLVGLSVDEAQDLSAVTKRLFEGSLAAQTYVAPIYDAEPNITIPQTFMSQARQRLYALIPGLLVWVTLIVCVLLSFIRPLWMIYFIILFDLYWLLRILYFIPFLLLSWYRYHLALKRNWQVEAEVLPGYEQVEQLIFLPTYKEDLAVVEDTLKSLIECPYPTKRLHVILAGEERDVERFEAIVKVVKPRFQDAFGSFFTTIHPKDLPDEMPGKGSNLHWAAQEVVPKLLDRGIKPEQVIVSSFDIDTIVHPQYFSCLTYHYLTVPEPTRSSYQPVALYNNNLWESPAAVRVAMFGTTFWLMTELARPEGMMTFSSHSMSLRMLIDVGFWQKDIVSEDSRIFLQGLIHYHGNYRVTPIHLPVSMDTVMTGNYWKALLALYKQLRRWAWGVENFPYMVEAFRQDKEMPMGVKVSWLFKQLEGTFTWATAPLMIFILGYLPFWVAPEHFRSFTIFQNTPFTLQWLMRLAMIGLFVSATLALTLLPPRPQHLSKHVAYGSILLQWLLLPVTFVLFGALPAIDAQTRLMLGRNLGFNVSPKRTASTKQKTEQS